MGFFSYGRGPATSTPMKRNLSEVTAPALSSIGACSETDRQVMHRNNFVLIALIRNVKLLSNVLLHFFFFTL